MVRMVVNRGVGEPVCDNADSRVSEAPVHRTRGSSDLYGADHHKKWVLRLVLVDW